MDAQGTGAGERAPEPDHGACFGYRVRSTLAFRSLRAGDGPPLEVMEDEAEPGSRQGDPLLHWADESGRAIAEVYPRDGEFDVWIDEVGWFRVDPSIPAIAVPREVHELRREARLWGIPAILCLLHRGDLPVHAAAVDVGGSALLLAAPGRYGKTTLAGAFVRAGYRLLSEDVACCRSEATPSVLPGPAMLRVRRDMYEWFDVPGTTVVAEDPDRVYLTIDGPGRGDASPVPLRAVVFLRSSDDGFAMEQLSGQRAVQDLWALSLNLPTDEGRARCFQEITSITARVPVWNLYRRLTIEELPETVDRIVSTCL